MGFSGQEYWSGLLSPPPEDFLGPGIQTASLVSPALAGGFPTTAPNQMSKIILKIVSQRIKQSPKKLKCPDTVTVQWYRNIFQEKKNSKSVIDTSLIDNYNVSRMCTTGNRVDSGWDGLESCLASRKTQQGYQT